MVASNDAFEMSVPRWPRGMFSSSIPSSANGVSFVRAVAQISTGSLARLIEDEFD
jgi:hypothetical protein